MGRYHVEALEWPVTVFHFAQGKSHMPSLSIFFGIVIRMFYNDHPPPHFHAEHQGQKATFTFDGELLAGEIQSRVAKRLIKEWAKAHEKELALNWSLMRKGKPFDSIEPLS